MKLKYVLIGFFVLVLVGLGAGAVGFMSITRNLPPMLKVEDYKPLLVSEVYARGGEKIGEFFRENRILTPYEKIPKPLVNAFLAAEDDQFFQHGGINFQAIFRAMIANLRAGRTVQGGSTITQQVAKSLLLSPEKTYIRKLREAILAHRMESNLSKEEILYLYLNQIYLGQGAYGVAAAADTYYRKKVEDLTLAEMAVLAGLPQAPSRYSPVSNPKRAKERQKYVLGRMADVGFISQQEADAAANEPIQVYAGKEYKSVAPFYVETVRQLLVAELGETMVLDSGLKIYTAVDFVAQQAAQERVREGLRQLDKRQGYRGPLRQLTTDEEKTKFLLETRRKLSAENTPVKTINADGSTPPEQPIQIFHKKDDKGETVSNLPDYVKKGQTTEALVTKVDDKWGLVHVRFGDVQALMDVSDMSWARKPDPAVSSLAAPAVKKPSLVVKPGDVVLAKVAGERFYSSRLTSDLNDLRKRLKNNYQRPADLPHLNDFALVVLEQEPAAQSALISFDQDSGEVIAMVGGYDFDRSEFNRAIQAKRQVGSAFKAIVYAAALDKGYTPATPVLDAPIVYENDDPEADEGQEDAAKKWKPHNYTNKFEGDILFRNALVRSLNIPTVKILEDIGIDWSVNYARRLGLFSPLNRDLSLGLGTSGVTVYEMTKVFSQFGRMGKRLRPLLIHRVLDHSGNPILEKVSLDRRFKTEMETLDNEMEQRRQAYLAAGGDEANTEPSSDLEDGDEDGGANQDLKKKKEAPLFFKDPDQLIRPATAYLITSLLSATITDEGGTGGRARALGRSVAGKTGTTNGYFDAWFIGYTPQIATGVWVGFDEEKSLGVGEAGGRVALPIWVSYMQDAHKDLPNTGSFTVPQGIVFANIDNQTGKLASASSKDVVRQAFLEGSEPRELNDSGTSQDEDFYKEDLTE